MEAPAKKAGSLNIPREALFAALFVVCSILVFVPIELPNRVSDNSASLYKVLRELDKTKPVILQSDWTKSTRGESGAQFDALVRVLIRDRVKIALMSGADPQAPEVARTQISRIANETEAISGQPYRQWEDWVFIGYFPGIEASLQSFSSNLRNALSANKDTDTGGTKRSVMESPVFDGVNNIEDLSAYIIVTASKTSRIAIERLSGKVTMLALVTGVMGPETYNYYQSDQLQGLAIGLKGAYDLESMLAYGLNVPGGDGAIKVSNAKVNDQIPGYTDVMWDKKNLANGQRYIVPLHGAIFLLITAIVLGNVETIRQRRRRNG